MDLENDKHYILEWTIKNFSCWNIELHDKVITSGRTCSLPDYSFVLYPRGRSAQEEHMGVSLCCSQPVTFSHDLSYIGPDGSVLFTSKLGSKKNMSVMEFPDGPNFEWVVAQIRKRESHHGDSLVIRWRKRSALELAEYMCTTIRAYDASFRISSKISSKVLGSMKSTRKTITAMNYPLDGERMYGMVLEHAKHPTDRSKIVLKLTPAVYNKNIFGVFTRLSVVGDENEVRTERNAFLFLNRNSWEFCKSLTLKELAKEGFSLHIHLKMIPSSSYEYGLGHLQYFPDSIQVTDTSSAKPPSTIVYEGRSSDAFDELHNPVTVLTRELVYLRSGDVSIPVHKNILRARSPIFRSLLSEYVRSSPTMDEEDLDPSALACFVAFLYTGVVKDLRRERALKLFHAADKFQMPFLQRECEPFLGTNVTFSNVCDILSLGWKRHWNDQLTQAATDFFLDNYNDVLSSEEWATFMKNEPVLAVEILTYFGAKKYVKK